LSITIKRVSISYGGIENFAKAQQVLDRLIIRWYDKKNKRPVYNAHTMMVRGWCTGSLVHESLDQGERQTGLCGASLTTTGCVYISIR